MIIKNIGILTSGGDSPGMNTVIRSVVRSGIFKGYNVYGINEGFFGLYNNYINKLNRYDVSDILNKGGTFLGSSRFLDFKKYKIRLKSIENLYKSKIDILIVVGGNGSYFGAYKLFEMGFPIICIPGTIDNDIYGTNYTIGFFTALETIVNSIDNLRDTSSSHKRILIIEVMGRNCGDLAIFSSIAGGCEFVIFPEIKVNEKYLIKQIKNGINKGKKHSIVIVTENTYNIKLLSRLIEKTTGRKTCSTILGYIQRGGKPTSYDRILASKMGDYAINLIYKNIFNKCIGIKNEKIINYDILDFVKNINKKKKLDKNLINLTKHLF